MDIYLISLLIGGIGLTAMGLMGLGSHGHDGGGGHGHAGHGHGVSHGHSGHGDAGGHGGSAGHVGHAGHGGHGQGHDAGHHHEAGQQHGSASPLWQLMSPRVIFSIAFGLGATGFVLKPVIGGPVLLAAAIVGGIALERFIVQPLWNWFMRFGSNPAMTLESAITSEATVVSSFDANGNGLVSIEVDGQVVQLLATLRRKELGVGDRVRAGDTVRIEDIDAERNRCTVSRL